MPIDLYEESLAVFRRLEAAGVGCAVALRLARKASMSPEALSRRLRQVEELRRVCLSFARRRGRIPRAGRPEALAAPDR